MPRLTPFLVLTAVVVVAASSACADQPVAPELRSAGSGGALGARTSTTSTTSTVNVTSTLYDADTLGNLLLTRSDDYNGTGLATYVGSKTLTSEIGPGGAWKLVLNGQSVRTIYLVLASQGVPIPDGYYSAGVEVYSQCYDASGTQVSLLSMAAGAANGNCSFGVDFATSTTKYKLVMGPAYSNTGRATVTCKAATATSCTSWTIVPNAGAANAGVANLYTISSSRGQVVLVYDGTYHNSYSVTAAE